MAIDALSPVSNSNYATQSSWQPAAFNNGGNSGFQKPDDSAIQGGPKRTSGNSEIRTSPDDARAAITRATSDLENTEYGKTAPGKNIIGELEEAKKSAPNKMGELTADAIDRMKNSAFGQTELGKKLIAGLERLFSHPGENKPGNSDGGDIGGPGGAGRDAGKPAPAAGQGGSSCAGKGGSPTGAPSGSPASGPSGSSAVAGSQAPTGDEKKKISDAIEKIKNSAYGQTPEGRKVVEKLEQLNAEGKIKVGDLSGKGQGTLGWGGGGEITLDPKALQGGDLAKLLVHEGTHEVNGNGHHSTEHGGINGAPPQGTLQPGDLDPEDQANKFAQG